MQPIRTISIIGSGNVATHLAKAFSKHGVTIRQIYSQTCDNSEVLAWQANSVYICDLHELQGNVDLFLFAVKDEAIQPVYDFIGEKFPDVPVAHTSGSVGLSVFCNARRKGIFYPLQSFSKTKKLNLQEVPFLITSDDAEFKQALMDLASLLSRNVLEYSDDQRRHLHIAAVLVNNFSNHLFALAQDYCDKHQLNFQLLMPLIHETIHKIDTLSPREAQTGPAKRGDEAILKKHLSLLEQENPELLPVYQVLSESIRRMYFPLPLEN